MQPPDRARVRQQPRPVAPDLVLVNVAKHEGGRLGAEQARSRELVVEARHRHAVLGETTEDGPVRNAHGRDARQARLSVYYAPPTQQSGDCLADRFGRGGGAR